MGTRSRRVVLVGAAGTIGSAVAAAFRERGHDVVAVGRSSGDFSVDLANPRSISVLFAAVGRVDAVVCTAGVAKFGALTELTDEDFDIGLRNKVMGQVNLVRLGLSAVREGGSFTLTSGTLSHSPGPETSAVALAGGAVESFVRAAAIDLAPKRRVNAISPGWVAESKVALGLEPMPGIWAKDLAAYYVEALEGDSTGTVTDATEPMS